MAGPSDADRLFKRLDVDLLENVEDHYFQEPRDFRSLIQVLKVLNDRVEQINRTSENDGDLQSALKERNPGQLHLQQQLDIVNKVIEEVVTFQHGGLNHSVDTMGDVVKEYSQGREEIQALRKALAETQSVLTARKDKKTSLRELWLRKVELQESLRMVRDLEELKNTPLKVQRLMGQKKYYTTVQCLTSAVEKMFGEDLVSVGALTTVREKIMDLKEVLLETCVAELKEVIIGTLPDLTFKDSDDVSDSENGDGEGNSETMSVLHDDARSVVSFRAKAASANGNQHRDSLAPGGSESSFSFYSSLSMHQPPAGAAGAATPSGATTWSLDLQGVDESAEAALLDPSSAGPLFMRLLVKTIGVLRCEDDVERMVLESLYQGFVDGIVTRCRELALGRLAQVLQQHGGFDGDDDEVLFHGKCFARYAGVLLDGLLGLVQRLLYVFRLLAVSKHMRGQQPTVEVAVTRRKSVCELWSDLEDVILRDLRIHFVEADVEKISDRPTLANYSYGAGSSGPSQTGALVEDDEDRKVVENRLIFRPAARHSAGIYRKVVAYSHLCTRLQRDNDLAPAMAQEALEMLGAGSSMGMGMGMGPGLGFATAENKVLQTLHVYIESDLVPVVQSAANHALTDLQLRPELFAPLPTPPALDLWQPSTSAAEVVFALLQSLYRYWLQLFMHRDMVTVVIDRALRGFAMAIREAREPLAYAFLSTEGAFNKEICRHMRADPLFAAYKQRVFLNRRSLDEAVVGAVDGLGTSSAGSSAGSALFASDAGTFVDDRALFAQFNKEAAALWPAAFWDLSAAGHPATAQRALKGSAALQQLASLAYCADWLVRKAVGLTNQTSRHGAGALLQSLGAPAHEKGSQAQAQGQGQTWRSLRSDLYESKHHLAKTVLEGLRDLSRCADESMAILRGELQLLAFHFIVRLAITPFLPTALDSAAPQGGGGQRSAAGAEEEVVALFVQQLSAYLQACHAGLSPFALPALLGPICALVPRLLSRAIMAQFAAHPVSVTQTMVGAWKTRLLRLVVSAQQQVSLCVQSALAAHGDLAEARRQLGDVLTLGFEALRRVVAAIDIPALELRSFVQKHFQDVGRDEVRFLFLRASDKSTEVTLDELLRMHEHLAKAPPLSTVAHA